VLLKDVFDVSVENFPHAGPLVDSNDINLISFIGSSYKVSYIPFRGALIQVKKEPLILPAASLLRGREPHETRNAEIQS